MANSVKDKLFLKLKPYVLILTTATLFMVNVMMLGNPFLNLIGFFPLLVLIGQEKSFKKNLYYMLITGILLHIMGYPWVYSTMITLLHYSYLKSAIIFVILTIINSTLLMSSLAVATYLWKKHSNIFYILLFPPLYFVLKISLGEMVPTDAIYGFLKDNDQYSTFYWSKVTGVHGLTAIFLLLNCLIYILSTKDKLVKRLLIFLGSSILILEGGGSLLRSKNLSDPKETLNITVIQAADKGIRDLELQHGDQSSQVIIEDIKKLIEEASVKYPKSDLLVFAENSFPVDFKLINTPSYAEFLKFLSLHDKKILIGGFTFDESKKVINVAFELDGTGVSNVYSKKILMPFGEYVPMAHYKWVREFFNLRDIYNTESEFPLNVFPLGKSSYKPIICYESLFSDFLRSKSKEADLSFVLANNYWSHSEVENVGYLYRSIASGIELGRPIVVSSNSGPSSALDANGEFFIDQNGQRIMGKLFEKDIINFSITIPSIKSETFYAKYGYLPTILVLFLLAATLIYINRKKL